ncbi:hypothetical protein [Streptomyces coeruleorubidus]|uniref:hypothetical protein n=1 Tax=Streptomyces coeruleorubidus TaxID=116188 RepID=UPI0037B69B58
MQQAMTDDFASTMVTVIPIVLIVGTAEVNAIVRTPVEVDPVREETLAGRVWLRLKLLVKVVVSIFWLGLIFLHAAVEAELIFWLASAERADDPQLAWEVAAASQMGFWFVTMTTVILVLIRLPNDDVFDLLLWETVEQTKPSPPSRRRMRPFYPAHRAVRRPSRRARSTPGR